MLYEVITDPEVADAIDAELERQRSGLEMIASENIVSEAVLAALGTVLTNKYAEGYPGKHHELAENRDAPPTRPRAGQGVLRYAGAGA